MKRYLFLYVLILALLPVAAVGYQEVADAGADAGEESSLEEAIIGIWKFPVDGYYIGFDADDRLCYGGSGESVAANTWCNKYAV